MPATDWPTVVIASRMMDSSEFEVLRGLPHTGIRAIRAPDGDRRFDPYRAGFFDGIDEFDVGHIPHIVRLRPGDDLDGVSGEEMLTLIDKERGSA